jgi:hypothetical protein
MNAWKAQVEVKRYWEVVAENKSTQAAQAVEVGANLAARESGEWAKEDKFKWRTNCEWLIGVSRREYRSLEVKGLSGADDQV